MNHESADDQRKPHHSSDHQPLTDEYDFENENPIQLKSTTFMARRGRRAVYGKKGVGGKATRGYGRQRSKTQNDESATIPEPLPSELGLFPTSSDDASKFFLDIESKPMARDSFSVSNDFGFLSGNKELPSSDSNDAPASIHNGSVNENNHPNLPSNENNDTLPFSSSATAPLSCFSSLSRTGNGNGLSASLPPSTKPFQSFTSTSEGNNFSSSYLSPPRNLQSTSRKRGVCDSPVVHLDDQSSNAGISISRHSTSSYGSRRARSRIFSPESTKKIMEAALIPDICDASHNSLRKKNDESFQEDSDSDEEEEHNSSLILSTSIHDGDEMGHPDQSFDQEIPIPLGRLKRTASVNSGTFENAIFAPVELKSGKGDHARVFETMSSYEDLKFLIRELRKYYGGKQTFVFGSMNRACTVVPPKRWNHDRKGAFNQWVTSKLGFCLRSGGGMVSYVQTTKAKGKKTLEMLESALLSYKESSKNERSEVPKPKSKQLPSVPMSSIKITSQPPVLTPLLPSLKKASLSTPMLPGVKRFSLPR